ncbi:sugar ABC transporter substrate-binding protein [Actinobacteria bacterium YIM 96077]|uniref:Sugar ABC transporter substrate-binding protein n=1 Tax=Phytoactinopolyspora halophila TaxID=1981511 RepID=A0A329QZV4_9ACTN|nr:substrate-binding domain-containing protein [Phytoactinopolyspora halophila]AYY11702.1 sugar ABC transporter substrate-binding protein [Actinobacteria bacterium YIM 96077]RAW17865.1 sugar ABC transporter substrate-binding protein [Phytoactinopolyspora halophila]
MKRWEIAALVGALGLVLAACGDNGDDADTDGSGSDDDVAEEASGTVAFLLPENVTPRWEGPDREGFEEGMAEYAPEAEVQVFNAMNDGAQQQQQAEQAITQGAEVLVIAAVDMTAASVIVEDAEAADVPVIAYDRLIEDAPLDHFVTFDGEQVGRAQGEWLIENTEDGDQLVVIHGSEDDDNARWFADGYMPVLEEAVDEGTRTIGYESWTPGWDPSEAQESMEAALTQLDNDVQGVLSANDGMAATIIAALEAQGMAGEVPVTGQDATEQGLQLILEGDQGMSVFKDVSRQADVAAQISASLLADQEVPDDLVPDTVNNGSVDVSSRLLEVEVIDDEESVMLAVDAGLHELSDLCAGVSADVELCEDA